MTDLQVQEIVKVISNTANVIKQSVKPSFNWWNLFYSVISGGFVVGVFWLIPFAISEHREKNYYRKLFSLIISELRFAFIWITDIGVKHPNQPMKIETETWDMIKINVSKGLPIKLLLNLEGTYNLLKFIKNKTYNEYEQTRKMSKKDPIDLIESCLTGLLDLSKVDKKNKELFVNDFKNYRLRFNQANNSPKEPINK